MGCGFQRRNVDRISDSFKRDWQPLAPVQMFVDGAGDIWLVDHSQKILKRYRHQARFGAGQKIRHRIEIVAVNAVMAQYLVQHAERQPAAGQSRLR